MAGTMPAARRRSQKWESARSDPDTSAPSVRATSARPLIPAPPMPMKWMRRVPQGAEVIAPDLTAWVRSPEADPEWAGAGPGRPGRRAETVQVAAGRERAVSGPARRGPQGRPAGRATGDPGHRSG